MSRHVVPAAPHTWTYDTEQWEAEPILAWSVSDEPDEEAFPIGLWGLLPAVPRSSVLYDMTHDEAQARIDREHTETDEWLAGIRSKTAAR